MIFAGTKQPFCIRLDTFDDDNALQLRNELMNFRLNVKLSWKKYFEKSSGLSALFSYLYLVHNADWLIWKIQSGFRAIFFFDGELLFINYKKNHFKRSFDFSQKLEMVFCY